jgi:hypothetical protein
MNTTRSTLINGIAATFVALILTACGGGGGDGGSSSGSVAPLSVAITDAPVDGASEVVITFTGVTVQADDGTRKTYEVKDPLTDEPGRKIDLLALGGGDQIVLLDEVPLDYGRYSSIRLEVDLSYPEKAYIEFKDKPGVPYELRCSSCDQSDLKLNRSFTIGEVCETDGSVESVDLELDEPCGTGKAGAAFTIDFDLRKSITDPQSGDFFKLRPTLRIVDTKLAGNFTGTVDDDLIPDAELVIIEGASSGCSVYTFAGSDVMPDDIYLDDAGIHPNPVTTADVKKEGDRFTYTAAFLVAGEYTAALTCDAGIDNSEIDEDNELDVEPDPDNDVIFLDQQNVTVELGATTYDVNFPTVP